MDEPPRWETPADVARRQGVATSSPDREPLHGRPRSFWAGVLLGAVTLTLYYWYWQWQVFLEMHRQEGTRPRGWMVGLALGASITSGILRFFANRDGSTDLAVAGTVAGVASAAILTLYLVAETRRLDAALQRLGSQRTGAVGWLVAFNVLGAGAAPFLEQPASAGAVVGILMLTIVGLVGYSFLQAGLNRYWNALRLQAPLAPTGLSATAS